MTDNTNVFTLDDLNEIVAKKYGNLTIPLEEGFDCILVNALQLPKADRDKLSALQDELDADGDVAAPLEGALRVAGSKTPEATEELLRRLDGNVAKLAELFARYAGGTQVGEA